MKKMIKKHFKIHDYHFTEKKNRITPKKVESVTSSQVLRIKKIETNYFYQVTFRIFERKIRNNLILEIF